MAFDCVCVNFRNNKDNLETIKKRFPYAVEIPFVSSYYDIIKKEIINSRTEYLWILSTLCDYSNFDFDYIPEQHQQKQLHTWSVAEQKEGDTFLVPKNFNNQHIKFLRDYKDINYHKHTCDYDFAYDVKKYDLSNNFLFKKQPAPIEKYFQYSESNEKKKFFISYWEDCKIYRDGTDFYIPYEAINYITSQVYDYPKILKISDNKQKDIFDITYISNGEPFEQKNYEILKNHIEKHNLPNRLYWTKNVLGRTAAYKKAAENSNTEYFYAVFAKSVVDEKFMFDYTVDRGKSRRHYIFHADLPEVDLQYGTFNTSLYSKSLCLETDDENVLDFTLSKPHEVVPLIANKALLAPDSYTAWKNGFREVSKLVYWNKIKPTVETSYRIKKWLECENTWLSNGANDGKKFVEEINFNYNELLQTYTWDFCREYFKKKYPEQDFY